MRCALKRFAPRALLLLLGVSGCYESHRPERPVVPDPLVLVGVRGEGIQSVVERNDDGVVSEIARIPLEAASPMLSVSPDGRWAVVHPRNFSGDFYLVSIEDGDFTQLDWNSRGLCADPSLGRVQWFGTETFVMTCVVSGDWERYVGTLDGAVRRVPLDPGCIIDPDVNFPTVSPKHGVFLARCDDGDYLIRATGEVTLALGVLPRTESLNIIGPNTLAGFTSEFSGSLFRTWSADGPTTGALVPIAAVSGGGLFLAPTVAWHGELSYYFHPSFVEVLFDPRSGEELLRADPCPDGQPASFRFPPSRRHVLSMCATELTYVDVRSGVERTFSRTEEDFLVAFSRGGTRILFRRGFVGARYLMYDLVAEEWTQPWPDERVDQRWLLGHQYY